MNEASVANIFELLTLYWFGLLNFLKKKSLRHFVFSGVEGNKIDYQA